MNWRHTHTYTRAELIEYLREIRRNSFPNNWLLKREVILQANERNLIKVPEDISPANYHMVQFNNIIVVENQINQDGNNEQTTIKH
jgi:hypothetical protein